jgi:phosphatidate cytidylyltransferase
VQPEVPLPTVLLIALGVLTVGLGAWALLRRDRPAAPWLRYLWTFLAVLNVAAWWSFVAAVWLLALFSFRTLREYFSLVDIRLEDRWGILGAYLSIPFMTILIQVDWYGFFIVSIPVYAFIIVPFLVVLGGREAKGTVLSIGAIDFGLFLFVYCMGHIGYLLLFRVTWATLFIGGVALANAVEALVIGDRPITVRRGVGMLAIAVPITMAGAVAVQPYTEFALGHSLGIGALIPTLVLAGSYTVTAIERDLGIAPDALAPGRGQVIHGTRAYLFAAPIVFHYIRYFLEE